MKLDDLTGRVFGRLTVLRLCGKDKHGKPMWLCRCVCGNETSVRASPLRRGKSRSCGCLARDETVARSRTHGMTGTPEYDTWRRMKQRCYDETIEGYPHYGGRGIRVCDRWVDSFENFLADMGTRPGPGFTIEREDVNGHYEPTNCVWATVTEQNRNKRTNVHITAYGKTQLAADWSRETGLSHTTISDRLNRGWDPERAVTPIRRQEKSA